MSRRAYSWAVLAGAVIAYFVIFPSDLGFVQQVSSLTQAVATGAWALLIAVILVAGAVRIWGQALYHHEKGRAMIIDQLIFVGLRGYVVALDRESGEIVWSNDKLKSGMTTLLLDGDRLIASTNGYLYCLDPLSGHIVWQNPLKGYGTGVTDLTSVRGKGPRAAIPQAAAVAAQQAAAATTT